MSSPARTVCFKHAPPLLGFARATRPEPTAKNAFSNQFSLMNSGYGLVDTVRRAATTEGRLRFRHLDAVAIAFRGAVAVKDMVVKSKLLTDVYSRNAHWRRGRRRPASGIGDDVTRVVTSGDEGSGPVTHVQLSAESEARGTMDESTWYPRLG